MVGGEAADVLEEEGINEAEVDAAAAEAVVVVLTAEGTGARVVGAAPGEVLSELDAAAAPLL